MKKDFPLKKRAAFLIVFFLFWHGDKLPICLPDGYTQTTESDSSLARETKVEKTERYHKQTEQLLMDSAEWVDSFFGSEIYTAEVNRTYLRFRLTSFVEDGESFDSSARFKLRLRLPNTEKRFRLTIASDPDEIDRQDDASDDVISDRLEETDDNLAAALEYFLLDRNRHNVKFSAGATFRDSTPVVYGGARYRYLVNYRRWTMRFVERLRWYTDDGWDIRSEIDFERQILNKLFFRTTPALKWQEKEDGFEYTWTTSLFQPLNKISALEYQFNTYFDTEISGNLKESNTRIRYRRQVWREWLIFEVTPQLAWYEERDFKTVAGIAARIEIWIGRYKNLISYEN